MKTLIKKKDVMEDVNMIVGTKPQTKLKEVPYRLSHSLSIVIPAYNEENNVEQAVVSTLNTLKSLELEFEIIIVDDNSKDRTSKIIEDLSKKHKQVSCLHNAKNLGIGGAFRTGLEQAEMEYVMLLPADNPLSADDLQCYLPRIGPCDIVVGKRIKRVGYTLFMRFYSFVYNRLLIPLLFNIGVSDVNWIQIYRRSIFGKDKITIEYSGIFFLVEILIKARSQHLIIAEVPTKMKRRMYGKPTSSHLKIIWQTFSDMMKFFVKHHREKS